MRKKLAALASIAALATALALPGAASAAETKVTPVAGVEGLYKITGPDEAAIQAAGYERCGAGTCFFQLTNGTGELMWIVPSCGRHQVPGYFDGKATSAWNRTGTAIILYDGGGYTSRLGSMPGWFQGNLNSAHDNKMSSVDAAC
ncbi:peptidase inhibitor family I36 protein [Streptomyces sp. CA-278952]|uniref:peptidase inhibitor family I36 protein n=1 Tax=unclassified Streptomyces TaxID=2593676 RepID=UPI00224194A0|nr:MULTISPECIES: peptidase inhibitor family I36 protein [unclassified Streptomyces]UZI33419.1 peptidase inhibitor family I36 protein [Streptomyces sp. VB1]WDG33305.1 peptidase inhibitor family I36 protein [Streptomyces sp. CA-278952]